jgi:ribosomal protein S18 acetylase RimI-like enzyme
VQFVLREFQIGDYDAAIKFWRSCEGIGFSSADSPEAIARYLERNPGLSMVAIAEDRLIGTALAGHDGRRGYIHHLAVHQNIRRHGIGRELVRECVARLSSVGIERAHLFVRPQNLAGQAFWKALGWFERTDITMFSFDVSSMESAAWSPRQT